MPDLGTMLPKVHLFSRETFDRIVDNFAPEDDFLVSSLVITYLGQELYICKGFLKNSFHLP